MTHPDYADVQPVPDAPLHASTGFVVPKEEVAELAAPEVPEEDKAVIAEAEANADAKSDDSAKDSKDSSTEAPKPASKSSN